MAENKHTAGPWELWVSRDARPHTIVGPASFRISGSNVARIVDVNHYGSTNETYAPEQLANARLIAAAPDLLEFAVALDADWTREFPDGPETKLAFGKLADETVALWKQCRAAIARATQPGEV